MSITSGQNEHSRDIHIYTEALVCLRSILQADHPELQNWIDCRRSPMNEKLFRPEFHQMGIAEKQVLMERLAARYTMTFLGLHTFDRWGQSCTTGVFERNGREFVFVPGDTVTLGWDHFAVGFNQDSREELDYLFQEWEMEQPDPEELIRESIATVRQATFVPMMVGRNLEELCCDQFKMNDPRVTALPDWL